MVEKAMTEHHRKKSQYDALQSSLGLIFDKEDVNTITKDVMKKVFAQKHQHNDQQQHMQEIKRKSTNWGSETGSFSVESDVLASVDRRG